jgi:hypothetical protein
MSHELVGLKKEEIDEYNCHGDSELKKVMETILE